GAVAVERVLAPPRLPLCGDPRPVDDDVGHRQVIRRRAPARLAPHRARGHVDVVVDGRDRGLVLRQRRTVVHRTTPATQAATNTANTTIHARSHSLRASDSPEIMSRT